MKIEKKLTVTKRDVFGKCENRRLRCEDLVPGIFYTADGKNIAVQCKTLPLEKTFSEVSTTGVFDLEIEGEGTFPAMFWKVQKHPYKKRFDHIDFFGVDLDKPIKVQVPVEYVGTAEGVKLGGHLEIFRSSLLLKGKPLDIPAKVTIDVTSMSLNATVMAAQVALPENVSAIYDRDFAMMRVTTHEGASDINMEDTPKPAAAAADAAAPAAAAPAAK